MVRKKAIKAYVFLIVLYTILFLLGIVNWTLGTSMFHTGLPPNAENGIVIFLSCGSLVKAVYELLHI